MPEEKKMSVEEVIKETNKKYKADSLVKGIDMSNIEFMDTGCYSLNNVLGHGIPCGRIIEIAGNPSTGKTALAMFIASNIQKAGGRILWVDAERVFNPEYTEQIGIDISKLDVFTPDSGEQALDTVERHIATGGYKMVVVDSVAALVPEKELDSEPSDVTIALIAKMMSRHLRVVTGIVASTGTVLIFINQTRDNLMTFGYGRKTVTTGGKALPFYCSIRLEVKAIGKLKDKKEQVIGNRIKIETIKNKVGLPFRSAELDLYFERGIDTIGDLFDVTVQQGIIVKSGMTYSIGETKLGAGRDNAKKYIEEHPEVLKDLKSKLKWK
jgi:recombination protein RecA